MHCTQCGAAGEGRFCGACGNTLKATACPSCGVEASPGRRFCTACGSSLGKAPPRNPPAGRAPEGGGAELGWWISGVLLVVLLAGGGAALLRGGSDAPPAAPPGAQGTPPGQEGLGPAPEIDLSSMSAREAADRLFYRVMAAVTREDTGEVERFLPMALDAHELARPLDQHGLFHLSLLQWTASRHEAALATAEGALEEDPDHLLNLAAAAQAASELERDELARTRYAHLLEVWDAEEAREDRPEYEDHAPLLPELRRRAEEFLDASASAEDP